MGFQAKQKPCTLFIFSYFQQINGIVVSPVHFSVEFILLKQPSDCMLDTMVPIAGRLEDLEVRFELRAGYCYQVTES